MLAMNPITDGRYYIIDLAESYRVVCIVGDQGEVYCACDCGCTALSDRELKYVDSDGKRVAYDFKIVELLDMTNEQLTELFEPLRQDAPVYADCIPWSEYDKSLDYHRNNVE